jgi:hypothetical protein
MSNTDLVHLYFDRSNALQGYWTLYVVIIGGLLAFSSMRQRPSFWTTVIVAVLYCCFAYKNLGAIGDTTHQRIALLESIRAYAGPTDAPLEKLKPTLDVPDYEGVKRFHVFCDVLTVIALFSFEIRRRRFRREDEAAAVTAERK